MLTKRDYDQAEMQKYYAASMLDLLDKVKHSYGDKRVSAYRARIDAIRTMDTTEVAANLDAYRTFLRDFAGTLRLWREAVSDEMRDKCAELQRKVRDKYAEQRKREEESMRMDLDNVRAACKRKKDLLYSDQWPGLPRPRTKKQ